MRVSRLYYSAALAPGAQIVLEPHAVAHVRVLRLAQGDSIILFNGQGGEYRAELIELSRQRVLANVIEFISQEVESPLGLHLGQVISRGEKMDLTIQKAVELGVKQITPLFSERCGVKLEQDRLKKKIEHWQMIAISACEQSGRNHIPSVHPPERLATWVAKRRELSIVLEPSASSSFKELYSQRPAISSMSLLVGPEGGFSQAELILISQNAFHSLRLGPRILRTETAGLVALGIIQSYWGDIG